MWPLQQLESIWSDVLNDKGTLRSLIFSVEFLHCDYMMKTYCREPHIHWKIQRGTIDPISQIFSNFMDFWHTPSWKSMIH